MEKINCHKCKKLINGTVCDACQSHTCCMECARDCNDFIMACIDPPVMKAEITTCKHCEMINDWSKHLSENPDKMTNREHWLLTEMFVYLHDGKVYCMLSGKNKVK